MRSMNVSNTTLSRVQLSESLFMVLYKLISLSQPTAYIWSSVSISTSKPTHKSSHKSRLPVGETIHVRNSQGLQKHTKQMTKRSPIPSSSPVVLPDHLPLSSERHMACASQRFYPMIWKRVARSCTSNRATDGGCRDRPCCSRKCNEMDCTVSITHNGHRWS